MMTREAIATPPLPPQRVVTLAVNPLVIAATSSGLLGVMFWLAPGDITAVAILAAFVGGWASAWSP